MAQASEEIILEAQRIKDCIERLQDRLEVAINSTPTSEDRNKLTEANIMLMSASATLVHFT